MPQSTAYVRYFDGVEVIPEGEDETIAKIIASMTHESEKVAEREHNTVRASHAKASAFLKGELRVRDNLPPELRQGLFAEPRSYAVAVRMAQGPGEHLSDSVSTHRGMAIKVLDVDGPKLPGHDGETTQDFVFATGAVFPNANAAAFLTAIKGLEAGAGGGQGLKTAISTVARAANSMAKAITGNDIPLMDFFGHTPRHPLTDSYHSQAALRYGDYLAKIAAFPISVGQEALGTEALDTSGNADAFRHATVDYFSRQDAEFEIRVQLCTDLDAMPIEDASVQWPEDLSPYRAVARLVLPQQNAMGEARSRFMTEKMAFQPSHSLAAHRPLGSLMRARLRTYPALAEYRQRQNHAQPVEPKSLDQIPN